MKTIMKAAFGTGTYTLGENGLEKDQEYPIQVGQILFLNGYGQTVQHHERLAVYKIEDSRFGTRYHCVNLDKPSLCIKDHIRPVEKLHGIGIYFIAGDVATQEEIDEVLPMAQAHAQRESDKRSQAEKEQKEKEEIARKWWADNTPKWAKAYIVAELKKDESDSMSDYFHASTSKVLLLAWSASDRLNFKEMREAGRGVPEIENVDELKEDRYKRILGNYYHGWTIKKYTIGKSFNSYKEQMCVSDPANIRIKKEIIPVAPTGAQPTGDKIAVCKLNPEKGGIELYFNTKPSQAVLDDLKIGRAWSWSKFKKCWYRLDNPIARQQALKYADIPQEEQENAGIDNWAQANGI